MGEFGQVKTRFPVNRKDHTKKGPYLVPLLKRLLNKKMKINDDEVRKVFGLKPGNEKATLKKVIMLRYILNAVEGENQAIEGILDRVDGKTAQKLIGEGFGDTKIILFSPKERENADRANAIAI